MDQCKKLMNKFPLVFDTSLKEFGLTFKDKEFGAAVFHYNPSDGFLAGGGTRIPIQGATNLPAGNTGEAESSKFIAHLSFQQNIGIIVKDLHNNVGWVNFGEENIRGLVWCYSEDLFHF